MSIGRLANISQLAQMTLPGNVTMTFDVTLIISWWGDHPLASPEPKETPPDIDATETDVVELGLAIHATRVYPGDTQEDVMDRMRKFSGLPLENWEQLGANIRRRGTLKFLDRLRNSLSERNEEIKENGRANRQPKFPRK
jgi:hypothetical protein